jgi:hypothetical protein
MTRRVGLLLAMLGLLVLPATVGAHLLDHAPPSFNAQAPPSPEFMSGGEDADWELVATLPTGNPHTDLDFFTHGGDTYASVGTLGNGPNAGGQTIARLTEGGEVKPRVVSSHPSASCLSNPEAALGLQHDVEASPKGGTILNTFNPAANGGEAQILVDATDAEGRCHDQGVGGLVEAPRGGLEIIDVAELLNPTDDGLTSELGLTSHVGESHTVNVDPRRPHIAYSVTSDAVSVRDTDGDGTPDKRENEIEGDNDQFDLDGFEVVDMSSCMYFPAGTSVQQKRDACKPQVYRYRYPRLSMSQGHTNKATVYGCHELELYPDDRLTCGSGAALIVLDMKGAFDDNGTPNDFTDDRLNGTPLNCTRRDSSTAVPGFGTTAKVTDCVDGTGEGTDDLSVARWLQDGAPSLAGVRHVGTAFHQGRNTSAQDLVNPAFPSTEDIDFNHESEFTTSRRFLLATDERGGGVLPPGASCPTSPADNPNGNGGVHAYRADALDAATPATAGEAFDAYARNSRGEKAIYRATIRTQPQASLCTAHVFQQIPGQNRIFMGWYSQGTQVVDFTENPNGSLDFKEAGYFIPVNANTWVSHVFKAQRNPDGSFTYWGATGDFNLGGQGRSAIDVYKVTLPPPPGPRGGTGRAGEPGAVQTGSGPGGGAGGGPAEGEQCATVSGFRSVGLRRKKRGLRVSFARQSNRKVQVEVFRQTKGRRSITKLKRVKSFRGRKRSFTWNGRGRGVRDGYYVVRFRIGLPDGRADLRRIAVRRKGGRFRVRPAFQRTESCTSLVGAFRLNRPVFGGKQKRALFASFRLNRAADVKLTVTRNGKVVRTTQRRRFAAGSGHTIRLTPKTRRRGDYRVTIGAERGSRTATATLTSRRL